MSGVIFYGLPWGLGAVVSIDRGIIHMYTLVAVCLYPRINFYLASKVYRHISIVNRRFPNWLG